MIEIIKKEECAGCYACVSICPREAIQMRTDDEGFWYPYVNQTECVHCNLCDAACPIKTQVSPHKEKNVAAYAAMNKAPQIRIESSSGGVFSALAESIISEGGVVFGAAFSDDLHRVFHKAVDSIEALSTLRGSKYLQSSIGDAYGQAKKYLESGRPVLFTGTPCQIAGLYTYLQKNYPSLYTLDLICHGVPSSLVWEKYLQFHKQRIGEFPTNVVFRSKYPSWQQFSLLLEFPTQNRYAKIHSDDMYMRCFLKNLCLRPSCYACKFKLNQIASDISLGDFWGIERVLPEMNDDKGTSLVLIHTEKGNELLLRNSNRIQFCAVDVACAISGNSAAVSSVQIPDSRSRFMKDLRNLSAEDLFYSYGRICVWKKRKKSIDRYIQCIKRRVKNIVEVVFKR